MPSSHPFSRLFLLVFFPLLGASAGRAQSVEGRVTDEAGQPMAGVNVFVFETETGTQTDAGGGFRLPDLAPGRYTVRTSFIGYETDIRPVDVPLDEPLHIVLRATTIQTPTVQVEAERDPEALRASTRSLARLAPVVLARSRRQNVGDLVRTVPGVDLIEAGPLGGLPVVRGLSGARLAFIDAGLALPDAGRDPQTGLLLDPTLVHQLDIQRGPAVLEHGLGAVGGSLILQRAPLLASPGAEGGMTLIGGSNNGSGAGSLYLAGGTRAGFAWRVEGGGRIGGTTRTPTHTQGNTGYRGRRGTVRLGYLRGANRVEVLAEHETLRRGLFEGLRIGGVSDLRALIAGERPVRDAPFGYDIDLPFQNYVRNRASLTLDMRPAEPWRLESVVGYQQVQNRVFDTAPFTLDPTPTDDLTDDAFDAGITARWIGDHALVSTGVSGQVVRTTNAGSAYYLPNHRTRKIGVFVLPQWIHDDLVLDVGARAEFHAVQAYPFDRRTASFERIDRSWNATSLGFTINYLLDPTWSASGGFTLAWRQPDVRELFSDGTRYGTGLYEIGNRSLDGENSMYVETTIRHAAPGRRSELSLYHHTINGYLHTVPDSAATIGLRQAYPTFRYRQTNARLLGGEATGRIDLNRTLGAGATASVVRGVDTERDEPLFRMPPDRARLFLRWSSTTPVGALALPWARADVVGVRRQDRSPAAFDYASPPDGYVRLDLSAGGVADLFGRDLRLSADVTNVFDVGYREYLNLFRYFTDEPGRGFWVRLGYDFHASDR